MKYYSLLFLSIIFSLSIVSYVQAEEGDLLFTINSPESGTFFGNFVATTPDDNIVIGAIGDNTGAEAAGSVHIFYQDGILQQTINNPDPAPYDGFGVSFAISTNDDIVIGAFEDDTGAINAGSVYYFDDDGELLQTINNPDPHSGDYFGYSVAITSDDHIVVGAHKDDTGATNAGSVYVFDTNGNLLQTINNPDPDSNDWFGYSVATTPDDHIVTSAHKDDTGATNAGSVYVFDTNGNLLQTINNPDPNRNDWFGYSVATTPDDHIVTSAVWDGNAGSVYVFDTNGNLLQTINNPDPHSGDYFGYSVAITSDDHIVVGAHKDDTGATNAGSVYVFDTNGNLLQTINNPHPNNSDYFGSSVAINTYDDIVIGAEMDDTGGYNAGSVYVFEGE